MLYGQFVFFNATSLLFKPIKPLVKSQSLYKQSVSTKVAAFKVGVINFSKSKFCVNHMSKGIWFIFMVNTTLHALYDISGRVLVIVLGNSSGP